MRLNLTMIATEPNSDAGEKRRWLTPTLGGFVYEDHDGNLIHNDTGLSETWIGSDGELDEQSFDELKTAIKRCKQAHKQPYQRRGFED